MTDKGNRDAGTPLKRIMGVWSFFREAREELKKVAWPSRRDTLRYTGIVIVASVVVGMVIGGFDYILQQFIQRAI